MFISGLKLRKNGKDPVFFNVVSSSSGACYAYKH